MKGLLILVSVFISCMSQAQSLNEYKYVVVDNQYEFQNEANQYRLNEMMVFEINKRGLKAFRNIEQLPNDLNIGVCNGLTLKIKAGGSLRVQMTLEFINCAGQVVLTSKKGIGKTKDYRIAYKEALRDAMTSLDEVNYTYNPNATTLKKPVQKAIAVPTNERNITSIPKPEFVELTGAEIYKSTTGIYLIQSTESGFDLFKNKAIIGTLKQSESGCYLAHSTDFIGIAYKKDGDIMIEFDKNGTQFLVFKKGD